MPTDKSPIQVNHELACEINDVFRRSRLNVLYYGRRLRNLNRVDLAIRSIVAVGTSVSVGSMAFFKVGPGTTAFNVLAGVAIVLQALSPILKLTGRIDRLTKLWATYSGVFETMNRLQVDLKANDGHVPTAKGQLDDAMARIAGVATTEDDLPSIKARKLAQDEMTAELPVASLWYPNRAGQLTPSAGAAGSAAA